VGINKHNRVKKLNHSGVEKSMNMLPKYFTLHGFFEVYIKIEKRKKKKDLVFLASK